MNLERKVLIKQFAPKTFREIRRMNFIKDEDVI